MWCAQTITTVPNQMALGNNREYAVCSDPHSQDKYPQYPNCTISPKNWENPFCLCKLPGDSATEFHKCTDCLNLSPAPPSPPAPPHRYFVPHKSNNCSWVPGAAYSHPVMAGKPVLQGVGSKQDCCRACYENVECVVAAWHETKVTVHSCFLHYSSGNAGTGQKGVVGCVTSRDGPDRAF